MIAEPDVPGQLAGSVIVIDETGVPLVGVRALAQWISRRMRSRARRAFCWDWKRSFSSSSAFEPDTKTVVRPPSTTERMIITAISSISVKPAEPRAARSRLHECAHHASLCERTNASAALACCSLP